MPTRLGRLDRLRRLLDQQQRACESDAARAQSALAAIGSERHGILLLLQQHENSAVLELALARIANLDRRTIEFERLAVSLRARMLHLGRRRDRVIDRHHDAKSASDNAAAAAEVAEWLANTNTHTSNNEYA
jgi:Mg2+ and Co2+ transporter CorA